MQRQDSVDFLSAFAVGTILGAGVTLLLQPRRTPKERVLRQWKPYRKRMKRSYGHAREAFRDGSGATAEFSSEVFGVGRDIIDDLRAEVGKIITSASKDLQGLVEDQVKDLSKGLKQSRKKVGL